MGELLVWNVGEISYYTELNAVVPLLFWLLVRGKGLTVYKSEIVIDGSLRNKTQEAALFLHDLFPVLHKTSFWISFMVSLCQKGKAWQVLKRVINTTLGSALHSL